MSAYCGLACDSCPIHLATLEPDRLKQLAMRADVVRICAEKYGMRLEIHDVSDCDGCRAGGRTFSGCERCEIRKCAVSRHVDSCAFCTDYACDKLQGHFKSDPESRVRLDARRTNR